MPKSRDELKHEKQHRVPWISPNHGDGGWHHTPGTVRYKEEWEPLGDHVLLRILPRTSGAIVLAESVVQEKTTREAIVLKVGPGKRSEDDARVRVPLVLNVGDRVLIGQYSDWESADADWGDNFVICQQDDIRGVIFAC